MRSRRPTAPTSHPGLRERSSRALLRKKSVADHVGENRKGKGTAASAEFFSDLVESVDKIVDARACVDALNELEDLSKPLCREATSERLLDGPEDASQAIEPLAALLQNESSRFFGGGVSVVHAEALVDLELA